MKELYESPAVEIVAIDTADIIFASCGGMSEESPIPR